MSDSRREELLKLEPTNAKFTKAVEKLYEYSREEKAGRFLGSYVKTTTNVFSNVYVFSSEVEEPSIDRDTFVIIASGKKIDMTDLGEAGGYWYGEPFAWIETDEATGRRKHHGQFEELVESGMILTDDFAPVDNLLSPVFKDQ